MRQPKGTIPVTPDVLRQILNEAALESASPEVRELARSLNEEVRRAERPLAEKIVDIAVMKRNMVSLAAELLCRARRSERSGNDFTVTMDDLSPTELAKAQLLAHDGIFTEKGGHFSLAPDAKPVLLGDEKVTAHLDRADVVLQVISSLEIKKPGQFSWSEFTATMWPLIWGEDDLKVRLQDSKLSHVAQGWWRYKKYFPHGPEGGRVRLYDASGGFMRHLREHFPDSSMSRSVRRLELAFEEHGVLRRYAHAAGHQYSKCFTPEASAIIRSGMTACVDAIVTSLDEAMVSQRGSRPGKAAAKALSDKGAKILCIMAHGSDFPIISNRYIDRLRVPRLGGYEVVRADFVAVIDEDAFRTSANERILPIMQGVNLALFALPKNRNIPLPEDDPIEKAF